MTLAGPAEPRFVDQKTVDAPSYNQLPDSADADTSHIHITIGVPCGSVCMHKTLSANFMLNVDGALVRRNVDGSERWGFSYAELRKAVGLRIWSVCRVPARALSRQCTLRWHKARKGASAAIVARNYRAIGGADRRLLSLPYMRLIYDSENMYSGNENHCADGAAHDQRMFDDLERRYRTCCNMSCGRTLRADTAAEVCFFFGADQKSVSFYVLTVCADKEKCAIAVRAEIANLFPIDPFLPKTVSRPHK
jgi:hypothetical protein